MKTFDRLDPWEMLGLERGASAEEIRSAYERLCARLAPGSLALYSIADREEQDALQRALRAAYLQLLDEVGAVAHPPHAGDAAPEPAPTAAGAEPGGSPSASGDAAGAPILLAGSADASEGGLLRRTREARGISLDTLSQRTRIRRPLLEALEAERFADLPERVFVRGFVFAVAHVIGLDAEEVWAGYGARLESWSAERR